MDEFDIKVLEANGYSYIDGGIVDAKGNYVSSVEIGGKTFESKSDKKLWLRGQALEQKFANKTSDPILDNMMLNSNEKTIEVSNLDAKETLKTTKALTVKNDVKSSFKTEYKYPIVLITSLIIYLIIKKLIKQ